MARVRITKLPKALSGLEMKMSAGLYGKGTNGNPQFRKSSYLEAGKISQQPTEVRDTLQPVAREGANLEAEKGETAMVNIDGIPAHFKIGGKRHSEGGTPLNLPDNSFIFSDTAKMKIKDPIMLAQFGMVPKKAGYTPAEIAKKYDINKFRQVLADNNTTDLERKTAEMMIANYNMKLAKLALLQESSKGFPQGIPVVAMPYIMATGMNPEEFAQMDTQGEEEQPDADMGVSRYGGNIISQFDTKAYGGVKYTEDGLPMGQNGFDPTTLGGWGAGLLNVLEAPQRAMMYGLTGTAGLLSGKGWTGEYEMPSETIRRNFPGHPGLEFAADLLADPFLVTGVAKTIARSGLKKTIAKEAADLAMKDVNKKLTGYEVTRLALRNAAAKSKDVIAGKKTVDEVAKSYETAANLARLDAAFKAAEKVKASKKFANANLAKQATMVENQAIKAVGKVAQKQATGKVGEVAKTAAMLPIAGAKAVGKGIAKVAPPLAEGARYVGKKAVEAAENIGSANVQPLLFPATRIAGTGSKQLVYQDKISEAESRAQEAEAKVQQLQQQIAQPKKPAYGKIISGSIGAMGPGSIARQNLSTGDVEWFDQRTGKPWEQVVKQRVQPKPKDIQIKTKPKNVGTSKASSINLDEYQEVTE